MKELELIKNEVIGIMDNDPAHDFEHIMRVYLRRRVLQPLGHVQATHNARFVARSSPRHQ